MNSHKLSKAFASEVDCFLECANANQLNRYLRSFLLAYLHRHQHGFPSFHESLLCEIEILFYFIEEMGKEQRRRKRAEKATTSTQTPPIISNQIEKLVTG